MSENGDDIIVYTADFTIEIDYNEVLKIERMLKEKWKADNVTVKRIKGKNWRISFVTDNNRKVFALKQIVGNLGGKVLRWTIN